MEPPGEVGLLCTAPSVAALLMLLKREGLDGAKVAQVMAWVFVVVGTMFSTFFMVLSVGASASEVMSGGGMVTVLLAVQMTIPAAVRWHAPTFRSSEPTSITPASSLSSCR